LGSAIMIGYGGWLYMYEGLAIGTLVAYRAYWWQLYGPVYTIAGINDLLQRANAASGRVFDLLDHVPHLRDAPDARELPHIRGAIQFENVSFHYVRNSPSSNKISNELHNISLTVAPGTRVGLCGPSGAGKSTLLNLIPRFYDPQSGAIRIDGHDVRDVT